MKHLTKLTTVKQIYTDLSDVSDLSVLRTSEHLYYFNGNALEHFTVVFSRPTMGAVSYLQTQMEDDPTEVRKVFITSGFVKSCCVYSDTPLDTLFSTYPNLADELLEDLIDAYKERNVKQEEMKSIISEIKSAIKDASSKEERLHYETQLIAANEDYLSKKDLYYQVRECKDVNKFAVAFCNIIHNHSDDAYVVGSLFGEFLLRTCTFLSSEESK